MNASLLRLLERARRELPDVAIREDAFLAHVAKHAVDPGDLDAVHAGDLALAHACSEGDPAALALFDRAWLPAVASYVARVEQAPDFVAEVRQLLRTNLLLARDGKPPRIAEYGGRGPLAAWLRVAAVRVARDLVRDASRHAAASERAPVAPPSDPERAYLKEHYATEIRAALDATLSDLSARDRTLLRLYFVEGMSLASIGRIYHVHESTVQRRIGVIRERVLDRIKEALALDSRDLESNLALIGSRLDVHLSQHLRRP